MTPSGPNINKEDLLLLEFQEAWNHYRHLENSRTQYLGFFFTVLLGALGFIITLLGDANSKPSPLVIIGIFALVWLVFLVNFILLTNVRKWGIVLRHYEDVMNQVRKRFYAEEPTLTDIFYVRAMNHPLMRRKAFSVQKTTEFILELLCVLLTIVETLGAYFVWIDLQTLSLLLFFVISMYALALYALLSPSVKL